MLFSTANYLRGNGYSQYDVSLNNQRFVMLRIDDDGTGASELILVENWAEELPERIAN